MEAKIKGNWELDGLSNPTVSTNKPFHRKLWVPKNGRLVPFRNRIQICKGGWNHYYWFQGGKKIAPVRKYGDKWVLSTRPV